LPKAEWTTCPICNARLKADKLKGHLKNVHPKGVKTREERVKIVGRRKTASGAAKWIAIVAIIVAVILVSYYYYNSLDIRGYKVGDKPIKFTLTSTDGEKFTLDDHLGERPILIGFMSTECIHCSNMAYVFEDLYVNYSDKVEFVIVLSNDKLENGNPTQMSDVQSWANAHSLQLTVLWDKGGTIYDKYMSDVLPGYYPVMFIVNHSGKIAWSNKYNNQGERSYKDMTIQLDKVL